MESVSRPQETFAGGASSSDDEEDKSGFDEALLRAANEREIAVRETMLEDLRLAEERARKKNMVDPMRCSFFPSIGMAKGKRCKNRRQVESPYCLSHKAYVRRRAKRAEQTPVKRRSRRSRNSRQRAKQQRSRRSRERNRRRHDLGPPPAAVTIADFEPVAEPVEEEPEMEIDIESLTPPVSPEMQMLEERFRNL